jgi:hypothetical protein
MPEAPPNSPQSIFQMLATQFLEPQYGSMESAPMPTRMAMPDFSRPTQEPIDLGAGGPAPGSQRTNALSSIGNIMQTLAPLAGSALASRTPSAPTTGAFSNQGLTAAAAKADPFGKAGLNYSLSAPAPNFSLNKPLVQPAFSFKG